MEGIVFLDIDGVVNTIIIGEKPFNSKAGQILRKDGYYYDICIPEDLRVSNYQAILWLNKLCLETHSKIVISSTWRFDYNKTVQSLYNSGLSSKIQIIGYTPYIPNASRGEEITEFLIHNSLTNLPYVILDDDKDFANCAEHLVLCEHTVGLGLKEYTKALDILKK